MPGSMVKAEMPLHLDQVAIGRIIEMAWEDRTPFEAIESQFGLDEATVVRLMRKALKRSSYCRWRERVAGRKTKHLHRRGFVVGRMVCPTQYKR